MRALRFSLREALVSLARTARSTVMSIGTVAVAFVTLGGFFFVATNLQRLVQQWGQTAEISVFLRDGVDDAARGQLQAELAAHAAVARVEYVSKEQALTKFKTEFPELADMAGTFDGNPFPASIELLLRADAVTGGLADTLAEDLRRRPGVADVRYDRQLVERLMALVAGVRAAGAAMAGVLVIGAAFTVAAIVRLSLFARRDEIEIMRLVGAPFAFIRGPSVAEGTLIGGLGAVTALVVLYVLYRAFKFQVMEVLSGLGLAGDVRFLGLAEATAMVLAALVLGALTGIAVARSIR